MYILLLCIIPAEDNTADPVYYVLYVLVLYYVLILYYVLCNPGIRGVLLVVSPAPGGRHGC